MAALTTHYTPHTVQPHTTQRTTGPLETGDWTWCWLDLLPCSSSQALATAEDSGAGPYGRGEEEEEEEEEEERRERTLGLGASAVCRGVPVSACAEAFDSPAFCFPLLSAAVPFVSLATFTGVARSWWDPAADDADLLLRVDINGVVQSRDMRTGRAVHTFRYPLHILSGSLEIFSQPLTLCTTYT